MSTELVPHVDDQDQLIELVERQRAYQEGLRHRAAHILIFNSAGELLVTKRAATKATWPGLYDESAAETVQGKESYESAMRRGLAEELGITKDVKAEVLRSSYRGDYRWNSYLVLGFITLYKITCDQEIKPTDGEVGSWQFMETDKVDQLISEHPDQCTPWFVEDWQFYQHHK